MTWYDYIIPGHPFIPEKVGGELMWLLFAALLWWGFTHANNAVEAGVKRVRNCPKCGRRKYYCARSACDHSK